MKKVLFVLLASTLGFVLTAEAKMTKKEAKEACIAEGKVTAQGKPTKACIKEKMKAN